MEETKISLQDLEDLKTCGKFSFDYEEKEFFYSLKDAILEKYGMPYGYSLQTWDDPNYFADEEYESDIYATHYHILKRYYLSTQDGSYISKEFHIPTNEFLYVIWNSCFEKRSEHYEELLLQVNEEFKGKKYYDYSEESWSKTWEALQRLYFKFNFLLTENQRKEFEEFYEEFLVHEMEIS